MASNMVLLPASAAAESMDVDHSQKKQDQSSSQQQPVILYQSPVAPNMQAQQTDQPATAAMLMPPPMGPPPSVVQVSGNPYCRLANFEIERKIGRGQFSVVYRARCKLDGMVVALKKVQVSIEKKFKPWS